jgi:hypothetical protein
MNKIVENVLTLIILSLFSNTVYCEQFSLINEMVAASISGNENQVIETKAKIEAAEKPTKGDRKVARKLNDDALLALKDSKFDTAATILTTALDADKSDTEIASNLCYALIKSGKANQAEDPCLHSIMLNPNRAAAWANLSEIYANKSDLNSATAVLNITYLLSTNKEKTKEFFQKYLIDGQQNPTLLAAATQAIKNEGIKPLFDSQAIIQPVNPKSTPEKIITQKTQTNDFKQSSTSKFPQQLLGIWYCPVTLSNDTEYTDEYNIREDNIILKFYNYRLSQKNEALYEITSWNSQKLILKLITLHIEDGDWDGYIKSSDGMQTYVYKNTNTPNEVIPLDSNVPDSNIEFKYTDNDKDIATIDHVNPFIGFSNNLNEEGCTKNKEKLKWLKFDHTNDKKPEQRAPNNCLNQSIALKMSGATEEEVSHAAWLCTMNGGR